MIRAVEEITLTRVDDGRSAYDIAVDGGYSGSEEDFADDLASIPQKADQEYAEDIDNEVQKKAGYDDFLDIIYKLDGGMLARVSNLVTITFSADDVTILGDIYKKYFDDDVSYVDFTCRGATWDLEINYSNGDTKTVTGKLLDDYGIAIDSDRTPMSNEKFRITFGDTIGGVIKRIDELEAGMDVYMENTLALVSDVAQVAQGLEVYQNSIILNPDIPEVKVSSQDIQQGISNDVSITPIKISFKENNIETASLSNEKLYVTNEYITNYYPRVYKDGEWLGNLGFIARVNGHLSLKCVKAEMITQNGELTVQEVT